MMIAEHAHALGVFGQALAGALVPISLNKALQTFFQGSSSRARRRINGDPYGNHAAAIENGQRLC